MDVLYPPPNRPGGVPSSSGSPLSPTISDSFCFSNDQVCDEESISRLLERSASAKAERVFFRRGNDRVEVKTLLREDVAGKFGFEPRPRDGGNDA